MSSVIANALDSSTGLVHLRDMRSILQLSLFVVGVVGVGWLIGGSNLPGSWYAALAKPIFVPPNWAFPVAWTVLYVMIAIAGWRTFRQSSAGAAMAVWLLQLALNFLWSPVMFTMHRIGLALTVLVCLFAAILAYIALERGRDRIATALFLPYAAWVVFAGALNAEIWRLN